MTYPALAKASSAEPPLLDNEVLDLIPPLTDTQVAAGFVLDRAGVRTRRSYRGGDIEEPGTVNHEAPRDNWEWIPLTWAVLTAQDSFTAVELGAGWGPWIMRSYALARRMGITRRHIFGVEAEQAHFGYLQRHLHDNDVPETDCTLFHGLIAPTSGVALFPVTETPEKSWGLRQVGREGQSREAVLSTLEAQEVPGEEGHYALPKSPHRYRLEESISLDDLIGDTPLVDFMHVDIQGAEGKVLPATMGLLNERFRLLAVGTHSHEIEDDLRDIFALNGWICHHDTEMHTREDGRLADGHQVWRNPRFGPDL